MQKMESILRQESVFECNKSFDHLLNERETTQNFMERYHAIASDEGLLFHFVGFKLLCDGKRNRETSFFMFVASKNLRDLREIVTRSCPR